MALSCRMGQFALRWGTSHSSELPPRESALEAVGPVLAPFQDPLGPGITQIGWKPFGLTESLTPFLTC